MMLDHEYRCDCSCNYIQPVERPSPVIMVGQFCLWSILSLSRFFTLHMQSLSFAAQSLVVIIVGANMGQFSSCLSSSPELTLYELNPCERRLPTKVLLNLISTFGANISRKKRQKCFHFQTNQYRHCHFRRLQLQYRNRMIRPQNKGGGFTVFLAKTLIWRRRRFYFWTRAWCWLGHRIRGVRSGI